MTQDIIQDIEYIAKKYDMPLKDIHIYIETDFNIRMHALGDQIVPRNDGYLHVWNEEKERFDVIRHNHINKIKIMNKI